MGIVGVAFDRLAGQVRENERDRDCVNSHRPLTAAPDVTRERLMPTIFPRAAARSKSPRRLSVLPRWAHQLYAAFMGYFWLPCPVCGRHSGGHEWRTWDGLPSAVPDPDQQGLWHGICPSCTRDGFGYEGWPI